MTSAEGTHETEIEVARGRVLGSVHGERPGPTLMCVGGLHGNEPAGVLGLRRVLDALGDRVAEMSGDFVALAGNLEALGERRRFVDRDLNRAWTIDRLDALLNGGGADSVEDREQRQLLAE